MNFHNFSEPNCFNFPDFDKLVLSHLVASIHHPLSNGNVCVAKSLLPDTVGAVFELQTCVDPIAKVVSFPKACGKCDAWSLQRGGNRANSTQLSIQDFRFLLSLQVDGSVERSEC